MIRCGHCKARHATVAQVRECSRPAERPNPVVQRAVEATRRGQAYSETVFLQDGTLQVAVSSTVRPVRPAQPEHQTPCVCGPYDLCWGVRVATARRPLDVFRAYND